MILSDDMRRYIDDHRVARLATADRDGQPHVVPICYALLDDDLYFVIDDKPKRTHHQLRRLQNIRDNPRVAVVIDDYNDDWTQLAYLMLRGNAMLIEDAGDFDRALRPLRQRYTTYRDMALTFAGHPMVRIHIEQASFWRGAVEAAP